MASFFVLAVPKAPRLCPRKQRQHIAAITHAIQIFRVRQWERRSAAVRVRRAKRHRSIGIGIDPAAPDALPLGLRDPLRQIVNVDLRRRSHLWRRLLVFTLDLLPRRARGQKL